MTFGKPNTIGGANTLLNIHRLCGHAIFWQILGDRFDAGFNANMDTGSVMFKIMFAPGLTTPGIEVITKLDVEYRAPLQPKLEFVPEVL
jgi:hypothetical protein